MRDDENPATDWQAETKARADKLNERAPVSDDEALDMIEGNSKDDE